MSNNLKLKISKMISENACCAAGKNNMKFCLDGVWFTQGKETTANIVGGRIQLDERERDQEGHGRIS